MTAEYECSFCAKPSKDVAMLIAGLTGFICDECVALCLHCMADRASELSNVIAARPSCGKAST